MMIYQKHLPKILIIGESFQTNTGGGVTLSNLFKNWNEENIATVCKGPISSNLNLSKCKHVYVLGKEEFKWIFPLNLLRKKWKSGPLKFDETNKVLESSPKNKIKKAIVDNFFFPFIKYSGLLNSLIKVELSTNLETWMQNFNPDIIYFQNSTHQDVILQLAISKKFNQPKIMHMMDDWISRDKSKGILKNYVYQNTNNYLVDLFNKCDLLMGISFAMADEYKRRYDLNFQTFHNPINIDNWAKHRKISYLFEKEVSILYAGRIGHGIDKSLKDFAIAMNHCNKDYNTKFVLTLQTLYRPNWSIGLSYVKHKNQVKYDELPKSFSQADFLLLPIDFTKEAVDFLRFSMPTKASEYMASGTPVIVFSPENTAIVNYANSLKWAHCITKNKLREIKFSLKHLHDNIELRKSLGTTAITIAEKYHQETKVLYDFEKAIRSVLIRN